MHAVQPQETPWKDRAIARSQVVTDAWEVVKAWLGRFADWILYACMVINILQILPGVHLYQVVISTVMGVQVVTLDIAGFGLASLAEHAKENGSENVKTAEWTSNFLIALMIITLLAVTVGVLFPDTKPFMDNGEKFLILVRVVATVVYGHVVGKLNRVGLRISVHAQQGQRENELRQQLADLHKSMQAMQTKIDASPEPEKIDYQMIAEQVAPLVTVQEITQPAPIDYHDMAQHIAPLLVPPQVPTIPEIMQALKPELEKLKPAQSGTSERNTQTNLRAVHPFLVPVEEKSVPSSVVQSGANRGASQEIFVPHQAVQTGTNAPLYVPPSATRNVPLRTTETGTKSGASVPQKVVQGGTKSGASAPPRGGTNRGTKSGAKMTDEDRLEAAYQSVVQSGGVPTQRGLNATTGIDRRKIKTWYEKKTGTSS